jgi:hypothetical protein
MQIYSERKTLARAAGHDIAALDITVFQDQQQACPKGLEVALDLRVFGADVTNTWQQPLTNQNVQLTFRVPGCGTVGGKIDDVQGVDAHGAATDWSKAVAASFTLTGTAAVTLDILTLLPGLPVLLRPIVALLGGKVNVDLGATKVLAPLHQQTH